MDRLTNRLTIRAENNWSYVSKESPKDSLKWLHKLLAVKLESMANGEYTTWERFLFSYRTFRFPSGMIPYIIENAKKRSIGIDWDWKQSPPYGDLTIADLSEMFSYLNQHQIEAFEIMRKHRMGILKHAMGAGKSEQAIVFAYSIPHNTVFIADEKSLLYQAKDRWEKRTGTKAGIIGDGKYEIEKFTVASFDSLYAHRKSLELRAYLDSIGCMIIDEVHTCAAKTYWSIAMSIPAYYRYGLSATPYGRSDGMDPYVCAAVGPIIHEVGIEDLYGTRLVPPKVIFYDYDTVKDDYDFRSGGWISLIKSNRKRAKALLELFRIAPKPCLVFFEWKDHGYKLFKMTEKTGLNASIIHGNHSAFQRKQAIDRLNSGEIDILFASRIFAKGVDIPEVRSCINAAGMKAAIPALQKLGRGLRLVEGKESLVYFDLVDSGYPTNKEHSRIRYKIYKKEGLEVFKCSSLEEIQEIIQRNIGTREAAQSTGRILNLYGQNAASFGNVTRGKLVEIPNVKFMNGMLCQLRYTDSF